MTLARETARAGHPDGCALCETCDDMTNTDEEVRPGLDIPTDTRGDDIAF